MLPFLGLHIHPSIAERAVDATVRPEREAIEIVAGERHAHAEAIEHRLALVGLVRLAVAVLVTQRPNLRDASDEDGALVGENAGSRAIEHVIEAAAEDFSLRRFAVRAGLGKHTHPVRHFGHELEARDVLLVLPLLVHLPPILGGPQRDVVEVPVEMGAVVRHPVAKARRLGHVDLALFAERQRRRRHDPLILIIRHHPGLGAFLNGQAVDIGTRHQTRHVRLAGLGRRREFLVRVIGCLEMVGGDDAPLTAFVVEQADLGGLALELGHIPDLRLALKRVLAGGLAHDLAVDDELRGRFAGVVAAGEQEADVGLHQFELRRRERSFRHIAAVGRAGQRFLGIAGQVRGQAVDPVAAGCQTECRSLDLPIAVAVALKGLEDFGLGHRGTGGKQEAGGTKQTCSHRGGG